MSRFFPHAAYAEDQPFARTILTSHVLYRGFQTGATVGLAAAGVQSIMRARRGSIRPPIIARILRTTGVGALIGTVLMVPALAARMWGREDIEWQDRSWRLLVNDGQLEVDDFSLVGAVAGALASMRVFRTNLTMAGSALMVSGGAGAGTMLGVVSYMAWRYGIRGGEWPAQE
ncbi:hypothetical protein LTR17_020432 [Elasticomyces elasticus]|nr:hypothetical protein LTR17_020432 [Elasticomyces elasticus]